MFLVFTPFLGAFRRDASRSFSGDVFGDFVGVFLGDFVGVLLGDFVGVLLGDFDAPTLAFFLLGVDGGHVSLPVEVFPPRPKVGDSGRPSIEVSGPIPVLSFPLFLDFHERPASDSFSSPSSESELSESWNEQNVMT